jgi:hypothetical protein
MHENPGPCPICGAAHTGCRADSGPVLVVQLPSRDGATAAADPVVVAPPLEADIVQATLPPDSFTSGTYRRPKR